MKLYLSLLHSCSVLCFLCLLARTGNRPAQKGLGSAHTCMQPGRPRPTTYLDITGTVVWGYCMGSSAVFLYSHTQKPPGLSFLRKPSGHPVHLWVEDLVAGILYWFHTLGRLKTLSFLYIGVNQCSQSCTLCGSYRLGMTLR